MTIARLLVLSFIWGHGAFAQQTLQDSLTARLAQPMPDTARVWLLDQLGRSLMYSRPTEALRYAQEGLQLAREAGFKRGEARLLNRKGITLRLMGHYDTALEAHLAAAMIAEATHDTETLARAYNGLGIVYSERKDSRRAIQYFQKTRDLGNQLANNDLKLLALSNIGSDYALLNQLDSALHYTRAAYELTRQLNSNDVQMELINLGNIYKRMGKNDLALRYYRQSLPASVAIENSNALSLTYLEMAEAFRARNLPDSAISYARKSLAVAQSANMPAQIRSASSLLAALYEPRDARQAVTYLKLASVARDSLESAEKIRSFQRIEFGETLRQQEIRQAEAMYRSRLLQYVLLGIVGACLLVAGLLLRNNRQKHRLNQTLQRQRDEIDEQRSIAEKALADLTVTQARLIQKEKLASLGELMAGIAHEIQNPLNFVNNFADVSTGLIEEMKEGPVKHLPEADLPYADEILGDLNDNLQRISLHGKRASNIVRGMLEHARAPTGDHQPTDLNALAGQYLRLAHDSQQTKDKATPFRPTLHTDFDPTVGEVTVAAQDIARVLLNLFNNAFYALHERTKLATNAPDYVPTVSVSTHRDHDRVIIRVSDNGTGIAENIRQKLFQPFFTTKPTGEGTGLGLSLSYDIITKGHNGTLTVDSEPGQGSTFVISLPI